jgi:hypothetical protein
MFNLLLTGRFLNVNFMTGILYYYEVDIYKFTFGVFIVIYVLNIGIGSYFRSHKLVGSHIMKVAAFFINTHKFLYFFACVEGK